eukprot:scaffold316049_cov37-Prasinocladus_malaysianus.AAC.2
MPQKFVRFQMYFRAHKEIFGLFDSCAGGTVNSFCCLLVWSTPNVNTWCRCDNTATRNSRSGIPALPGQRPR